jgi:chromosome segregation ATPase
MPTGVTEHVTKTRVEMMWTVEELRGRATALPAEGGAVVRQVRERVMEAVEIVASALQVDPTLTDDGRHRRSLDIIAECLRQVKPLARQAEIELTRRRLADLPGRDIARLGRIDLSAPQELEAMSQRCLELAREVAAAALPDSRSASASSRPGCCPPPRSWRTSPTNYGVR